MKNTVKERLKEFINFKKISVNKFERVCGLSTGYIGNMRVSIQPDKIKSIVHSFPDLNAGWLLTGEGEMLKETYSGSDNFVVNGSNQNVVYGNNSRISDASTPENNNIQLLLLKNENLHLKSLLVEKEKQLEEKERIIELLMRK